MSKRKDIALAVQDELNTLDLADRVVFRYSAEQTYEVGNLEEGKLYVDVYVSPLIKEPFNRREVRRARAIRIVVTQKVDGYSDEDVDSKVEFVETIDDHFEGLDLTSNGRKYVYLEGEIEEEFSQKTIKEGMLQSLIEISYLLL